MYVPLYTHTPSQAPPSGSLELALGTSLFWAGKGKAGPRSRPLPDSTPSEKEGRKARTPGSSCQNRWSGGAAWSPTPAEVTVDQVSLEVAVGFVVQLAVGHQFLHVGEGLGAAQGGTAEELAFQGLCGWAVGTQMLCQVSNAGETEAAAWAGARYLLPWWWASSGRPQVLTGPGDSAGWAKGVSRSGMATVWGWGGTLLGPSGGPSTFPHWGCGCPVRARLLLHRRGFVYSSQNWGHPLVGLTGAGLCSSRHVQAGPRGFLIHPQLGSASCSRGFSGSN